MLYYCIITIFNKISTYFWQKTYKMTKLLCYIITLHLFVRLPYAYQCSFSISGSRSSTLH